jgi:hypothetical protein
MRVRFDMMCRGGGGGVTEWDVVLIVVREKGIEGENVSVGRDEA